MLRVVLKPGKMCAILAFMVIHAGPVNGIDIGTSSSFRQQRFESWGTSLAWFGNSAGTWSNDAAHAELMDLIFDSPNNLGLNYARYNIGGGQNPSLIGNFRPGAAVPGWVPLAPTDPSDTSTWNWNWDADPGQRKSLDAAIARGVNRVDAVSYSAPYWMTNSQDTAGAVGGGNNLQTGFQDELAHYHTEVLQHLRDVRGIDIGTFNPINEPDATWWQAGGRQEGMHVSQGLNQRILLEAVGQTLVDKGLDIGIAAADAFSANSSVSAINLYNATTRSYIKQINTHVYGGSGSNSVANMQALRSLADAEGWTLYQSEYGNNSTTGLLGGIGLANRITTDVNVMGVNGWTYWQAVEPVSLSGAGWGLLWADYSINGSLTDVRKQYHVMRQFTSYIRPGADILTTSDSETVAAYNSGQDSTVLVFTNDEASADTNVYSLLDQSAAYTRVIRTDTSGNFVSLGPADVAGSEITVNSPGTAVTTVVVHHRPNLIQNANFAGSGNWQTSGNANYDAGVDNTGDGSGGAVLQTNFLANSGAVWQEGIGDAAVDLTGTAFEFSLDMLFQNNSGQFEADTYVSLEFYGADGQTLTHSTTLDFAEQVAPITEDSDYRVSRTAVVQAPAGTHFVRPVISYDNVTPGKTGLIYLDNAYLQETRYVPRARAWTADADGDWSTTDNWQDDALIANNSAAYFGPHATALRTITMDSNTATSAITLDSEFGYRVEGVGTLSIGNGPNVAKIDVRSGSHQLSVSTSLAGGTEVQLVGQSSLNIDGMLDLAGHRLEKTGPGQLHLSGGLDMGSGRLVVPPTLQSTVSLGNTSVLDGTIELALPPGFQAAWGDLYTLADLANNGQSFSDIALPPLDDSLLTWEVKYLESSQLVAEVVHRADFDRNGHIDATDLAQWQVDYSINNESDSDGNGLTDGNDFLLWQQLLGQEAGSNTLVLTVDPTTGDALIENLSSTDFAIDAYTISSSSESLLTSWDGFSDQGLAGWLEALPTTERLSELSPTSALMFAPGESISLAGLFNTSGIQDIEFQFHDTALGTVNGRVVYTDIAAAFRTAQVIPEPATIASILSALLIATARTRCGRARG